MSAIFILILASLLMALVFLGGFIWAVTSGQYEDTCTPSLRLLMDDPTHRLGPTAGDNQSNHRQAPGVPRPSPSLAEHFRSPNLESASPNLDGTNHRT